MKKHLREISPFTYKLAVLKCTAQRKISDIFSSAKFAKKIDQTPLPETVYKHNSLIRRQLGNTDLLLQDNKAKNLALSTPKVSGILIRPGETFSFWHLVGKPTRKKGYREGVTISNGKVSPGIGGGMCQFTNLIHWMILHTPLDIVEHHHHDRFDLFPDFNRQVPFGTGTSIAYNYIDYRFKNNSDITYQLIVYVTDTHLCGELRASEELCVKYHIKTENEHFAKSGDDVFRRGQVFRRCIDKASGQELACELLRENNAKVMYDTSGLDITEE